MMNPKQKPFTFVLPKDLLEKVRKVAKRTSLSVGCYIRLSLYKALEEYKTKGETYEKISKMPPIKDE